MTVPQIIKITTTKQTANATGARGPRPQRPPKEGGLEPENRAACRAGSHHLASLSETTGAEPLPGMGIKMGKIADYLC